MVRTTVVERSRLRLVVAVYRRPKVLGPLAKNVFATVLGTVMGFFAWLLRTDTAVFNT